MKSLFKICAGVCLLSLGGFTGCSTTPPALTATTTDDDVGVIQETVSEHASYIRDWIKEL